MQFCCGFSLLSGAIPPIPPRPRGQEGAPRAHQHRVVEGDRRAPVPPGSALPVRQSSLKQVLHNTESAIRQYDLRGRAVALGWAADQITVIDIDQGQSGASAADREGFQQLVAEVSLGRAGIVLGLECSRLARNSADWHQLLELCGMTGTLICDEDGLYDPRNFNDRLLLGMKGQMSEAPLHQGPAARRAGPPLARHEPAGPRRIRGEVSGPGRAAAGAVGAAAAKAAAREPGCR